MSELIYDRTQADVDQWARLKAKGWAGMTDEERALWLAGMRGAYNAADLNRVGRAMNELAARLRELPAELLAYLAERNVAADPLFEVPYNAETLDFIQREDWTGADIPTPEELAEYLARVYLLRGTLEYSTDELPDSMGGLTYAGANAIEKALARLDPTITDWTENAMHLIDNTAKSWYFCGELIAEEA